jgi:hypothetical protein
MPSRATKKGGVFGCFGKGKTSSPCADDRSSTYARPSSPSKQLEKTVRTATTTARTAAAERTAARKEKYETEKAQRTAARTAALSATRALAQEQRKQRTQKREEERATYLAQREGDRKAVIQRQYDDFIKDRPNLPVEDKKRYLEGLYNTYNTETKLRQIQMAFASQPGGRHKRSTKTQNKRY